MRGTNRPGKRPRVSSNAERRLRRVATLALDMEEPLREAKAYVRALMLVSWGLMGPGPNDDARAIDAVAGAAAARLEDLERQWNGIWAAVRR